MAIFELNTPQVTSFSTGTNPERKDGEYKQMVITSISLNESESTNEYEDEKQLDGLSNRSFDEVTDTAKENLKGYNTGPIEFQFVEYSDSPNMTIPDKSLEDKLNDFHIKGEDELLTMNTTTDSPHNSDHKIDVTNTSVKSSDEMMLLNALEMHEYNSDDSPQFTYENPFQENNNNEKLHTEDKVKGVCYCPSDRSWTAWWTDQGRNRKKAFKVSLYGCEEARKMAIEYRQEIEKQIPELRTNRNERKHRNTNEMEIIIGVKSIESSPVQHSICEKNTTSNMDSPPNLKSSPKYNLRGVIKASPKLKDEFSSIGNNNKNSTPPNEKFRGAIPPYASFKLSNDSNLSPKEEYNDHYEYPDIQDSPIESNQQSPHFTNLSPSDSPNLNSSLQFEDSPEDLYTHTSSPNSQGIYFNRARQTIVAFIKTSQGKKYKTFSTRQYGTVQDARSMAMKWRETMLEQHQNEEGTLNKETQKKSAQKHRAQNSPNSKNLIRGISYSSVNKAWCTQWCNSTGVACLKSFSVSKYGDDGAKKKAMEQRQKLELSGQVGSRIPGVVFQDNAWKSSWLDDSGEEQTVTFKVGKDGMSYDCARRLAIACRKQRRKLNTLSIQEMGSPKKSFELTPDLSSAKLDSLDDFTLDSKSRTISSPNFNDNNKFTLKRYRKTPHQSCQPTPMLKHNPDNKGNTPATTHQVPDTPQTKQEKPQQQPKILFSPFILDPSSPVLELEFSDLPRGINYDRTKLAFYISYYNENNKLTANYFFIKTGYNLAKHMAIMFARELKEKGLHINYPSSSTRQESITPTTLMNNNPNLSPTSFMLDGVRPYVNMKNKSELSFSLLGKALMDNYSNSNSQTPNLAYSSFSTKCSSQQDSSNDATTHLSKSYIKSDNKFEYVNSLNSHQEMPNSSHNESSSTQNSLLNRIKGLKRNDEDANNNNKNININNLGTAIATD